MKNIRRIRQKIRENCENVQRLTKIECSRDTCVIFYLFSYVRRRGKRISTPMKKNRINLRFFFECGTLIVDWKQYKYALLDPGWPSLLVDRFAG